MIELKFPIDQGSIEKVVAEVTAECRRLQRELESTQKLLDVVQKFCAHPSDRRESGNTWGRDSWTRCTVCGKEW